MSSEDRPLHEKIEALVYSIIPKEGMSDEHSKNLKALTTGDRHCIVSSATRFHDALARIAANPDGIDSSFAVKTLLHPDPAILGKFTVDYLIKHIRDCEANPLVGDNIPKSALFSGASNQDEEEESEDEEDSDEKSEEESEEEEPPPASGKKRRAASPNSSDDDSEGFVPCKRGPQPAQDEKRKKRMQSVDDEVSEMTAVQKGIRDGRESKKLAKEMQKAKNSLSLTAGYDKDHFEVQPGAIVGHGQTLHIELFNDEKNKKQRGEIVRSLCEAAKGNSSLGYHLYEKATKGKQRTVVDKYDDMIINTVVKASDRDPRLRLVSPHIILPENASFPRGNKKFRAFYGRLRNEETIQLVQLSDEEYKSDIAVPGFMKKNPYLLIISEYIPEEQPFAASNFNISMSGASTPMMDGAKLTFPGVSGKSHLGRPCFNLSVFPKETIENSSVDFLQFGMQRYLFGYLPDQNIAPILYTKPEFSQIVFVDPSEPKKSPKAPNTVLAQLASHMVTLPTQSMISSVGKLYQYQKFEKPSETEMRPLNEQNWFQFTRDYISRSKPIYIGAIFCLHGDLKRLVPQPSPLADASLLSSSVDFTDGREKYTVTFEQLREAFKDKIKDWKDVVCLNVRAYNKVKPPTSDEDMDRRNQFEFMDYAPVFVLLNSLLKQIKSPGSNSGKSRKVSKLQEKDIVSLIRKKGFFLTDDGLVSDNAKFTGFVSRYHKIDKPYGAPRDAMSMCVYKPEIGEQIVKVDFKLLERKRIEESKKYAVGSVGNFLLVREALLANVYGEIHDPNVYMAKATILQDIGLDFLIDDTVIVPTAQVKTLADIGQHETIDKISPAYFVNYYNGEGETVQCDLFKSKAILACKIANGLLYAGKYTSIATMIKSIIDCHTRRSKPEEIKKFLADLCQVVALVTSVSNFLYDLYIKLGFFQRDGGQRHFGIAEITFGRSENKTLLEIASEAASSSSNLFFNMKFPGDELEQYQDGSLIKKYLSYGNLARFSPDAIQRDPLGMVQYKAIETYFETLDDAQRILLWNKVVEQMKTDHAEYRKLHIAANLIEEVAEDEAGDKPVEAGDKPVEADPKPAEADPKPAEADPKPAEADPKPAEADPKPAEADPKPAEADPKPAEADEAGTGDSGTTEAGAGDSDTGESDDSESMSVELPTGTGADDAHSATLVLSHSILDGDGTMGA